MVADTGCVSCLLWWSVIRFVLAFAAFAALLPCLALLGEKVRHRPRLWRKPPAASAASSNLANCTDEPNPAQSNPTPLSYVVESPPYSIDMSTEPSPAAATGTSDGGASAAPAKIDPVTQVQDAIDGLALSLFEALRGIRDATGDADDQNTSSAAAAGSASASHNSQSDDPDYDDFLVAFHNRDPHALEVARKGPGGKPPQGPEEYLRVLARMDFESDVNTAQRLAADILDKGREVEELVDDLPGMGRSRKEQMAVIAKLIEENREIDERLRARHREATVRRDEVRTLLQEVASSSLGIEEE